MGRSQTQCLGQRKRPKPRRKKHVVVEEGASNHKQCSSCHSAPQTPVSCHPVSCHPRVPLPQEPNAPSTKGGPKPTVAVKFWGDL